VAPDRQPEAIGWRVAEVLGLAHDVAVLRWPEEARTAARLAADGLPRLLLVDAGADPPEGDDCQEDWVRLPADDRDVGARLRALHQRASRHRARPSVDGHGRLLYRGRWVALSPIEEMLVRLLVWRFGEVVTYPELVGSAWPGAPASANALRVHVFRLRRRVAPLGLDVRSVRGSGIVLEDLEGPREEVEKIGPPSVKTD